MLLQSIAHVDFVSCVAVDDGYSKIPYQWGYTNLSSPIRRLGFAFCCINDPGLCEHLPHTSSLEVFRYSQPV
jgi:hypothetical protein